MRASCDNRQSRQYPSMHINSLDTAAILSDGGVVGGREKIGRARAARDCAAYLRSRLVTGQLLVTEWVTLLRWFAVDSVQYRSDLLHLHKLRDVVAGLTRSHAPPEDRQSRSDSRSGSTDRLMQLAEMFLGRPLTLRWPNAGPLLSVTVNGCPTRTSSDREALT